MVSNADYHSSTNSGWDDFLGDIAAEVDDLVVQPAVMAEFRKQIRPLAERWEAYRTSSEQSARRHREHWEKIKQNPTWQNKKAGPPEENWEWDKFYLLNTSVSYGPVYEMPAKYGSDLINKIREYLNRNKSEIQNVSHGSSEYQDLQRTVAEQEMDIAEIEGQLDELSPEERERAWIRTPPLREKRPPNGTYWRVKWWEYFDMRDEEVFGCWRPPIKEITEHPVRYLMPGEMGEGLPRPKNREEEYERYYVILSSIHDTVLTGCERIDNGIWPAELAESVQFRLSAKVRPYGPSEHFVRRALGRVRKDLQTKALLDDGRRGASTKQQSEPVGRSPGRVRDTEGHNDFLLSIAQDGQTDIQCTFDRVHADLPKRVLEGQQGSEPVVRPVRSDMSGRLADKTLDEGLLELVAYEVDEIITTGVVKIGDDKERIDPKSALTRFGEQIDRFLGEYKAFCEARGTSIEQQRDDYERIRDSARYRDRKAGPPTEGLVWCDDFMLPAECLDPTPGRFKDTPLAGWARPDAKLSPDPTVWPQYHDDVLGDTLRACYYATIAIIHDYKIGRKSIYPRWRQPSVTKRNLKKLKLTAEQYAGAMMWFSIEKSWSGYNVSTIEEALRSVKADLVGNCRLQTATGQEMGSKPQVEKAAKKVAKVKKTKQPQKAKKRRKRKLSSELTARQQEVYSLIHVQGRTLKQAALEMRCTPQNVSQLLKKAEEKIKARTSRSINHSKVQKLPEDKRGQVNLSEDQR